MIPLRPLSRLAFAGLALLTAGACALPEPECVPLNQPVLLSEPVECRGSVDCVYDFAFTGGAFGVNNFVTSSPASAVVSPPSETILFTVTGTHETTSPIWLQKTWRGCNPATSTVPCTTIVTRVTVAPTCP